MFVFGASAPQWARASSFTRFLDHTQRHTTDGRIPLDEWSARRRDLYLTSHNTHNRQTSMPPVGFETTIPANERPQTYALDRAATGIGYSFLFTNKYYWTIFSACLRRVISVQYTYFIPVHIASEFSDSSRNKTICACGIKKKIAFYRDKSTGLRKLRCFYVEACGLHNYQICLKISIGKGKMDDTSSTHNKYEKFIEKKINRKILRDVTL